MKRPGVDVYEVGHYTTYVEFRHKWMAWLFHILLNRSINHAGARNY